jgi:hypothetical protein
MKSLTKIFRPKDVKRKDDGNRCGQPTGLSGLMDAACQRAKGHRGNHYVDVKLKGGSFTSSWPRKVGE